jgi:hypothetical protein
MVVLYFQQIDELDFAAKGIHMKQKKDDSLFRADVDKEGGLIIESYMAGFFWEEYADYQKGADTLFF